MTRRRDFIKRSALSSAAIAAAGIGFGCNSGETGANGRYRVFIPGSGNLSLSEIQKRIFGALETVPVIDPHCHLDASRPAARNIADIILYHHVWIELVSAGMGQNEVTKAGLPHELADPQIEPLERVRRALPYLNRICNSTVGSLLRWLLSDLYEINGPLKESDFVNLAAIEWCLPKLKLVKQIFGEVLSDRVTHGMYNIDTALSVIPTVFHDAPKEIYGL